MEPLNQKSENEQGTPGPSPMPTLTPHSGGGAKPVLIIGILVLLIGGGIWAISSMEKDVDPTTKKEEVEKPKVKPKPKPREKVETTRRPSKTEMTVLNAENRDEFSENVGKWVLLEGKVRLGNEDGLIEFESPAGVSAQLVRGTAKHLTGENVQLISWMISEEKGQVDGVFDITMVEAGDLLPDKDFYTGEDWLKLVSLRNETVAFDGKLKEVKVSDDDKNFYLVFENKDHEYYGRAEVKTLEARKVTKETLEELVGKTIRLKGEVVYEKKGMRKLKEGEEEKDQQDRIYFDFRDEDAYDILD